MYKSGFAEIDLGIVADIETAGFPFYFGIATDEGVGEHDIIKIGEGADDGVLQDGIVDPGLLPYGHIGPNDGIADIAAGGNANRLNDNGILELVFGSNGPSEL